VHVSSKSQQSAGPSRAVQVPVTKGPVTKLANGHTVESYRYDFSKVDVGGAHTRIMVREATPSGHNAAANSSTSSSSAPAAAAALSPYVTRGPVVVGFDKYPAGSAAVSNSQARGAAVGHTASNARQADHHGHDGDGDDEDGDFDADELALMLDDSGSRVVSSLSVDASAVKHLPERPPMASHVPAVTPFADDSVDRIVQSLTAPSDA